MRFHFSWKSHFGVHSALYLCSHELRRNETQNGIDFISVILTEMKFQTGMRFSREHNLPATKWISAGSLGVVFNVCLKLNAATLSRKKKSGKIFVGEKISHFWKISHFSPTNFSNSSLFPDQFLKLKGLSWVGLLFFQRKVILLVWDFQTERGGVYCWCH